MSSLIWFRKGLRLHDNVALMHSLDNATTLTPIFCLDPHFVETAKIGPNRWLFLLQCLRDLDEKLKSRQSQLIVFRGSPTAIFTQLFKSTLFQKICFETDTEPYACDRDAKITELARSYSVTVESELGHTLYDPRQICDANGGRAPLTYQSFLNVCQWETLNRTASRSSPRLQWTLAHRYQLPLYCLLYRRIFST